MHFNAFLFFFSSHPANGCSYWSSLLQYIQYSERIWTLPAAGWYMMIREVLGWKLWKPRPQFCWFWFWQAICCTLIFLPSLFLSPSLSPSSSDSFRLSLTFQLVCKSSLVYSIFMVYLVMFMLVHSPPLFVLQKPSSSRLWVLHLLLADDATYEKRLVDLVVAGSHPSNHVSWDCHPYTLGLILNRQLPGNWGS